MSETAACTAAGGIQAGLSRILNKRTQTPKPKPRGGRQVVAGVREWPMPTPTIQSPKNTTNNNNKMKQQKGPPKSGPSLLRDSLPLQKVKARHGSRKRQVAGRKKGSAKKVHENAKCKKGQAKKSTSTGMGRITGGVGGSAVVKYGMVGGRRD